MADNGKNIWVLCCHNPDNADWHIFRAYEDETRGQEDCDLANAVDLTRTTYKLYRVPFFEE